MKNRVVRDRICKMCIHHGSQDIIAGPCECCIVKQGINNFELVGKDRNKKRSKTETDRPKQIPAVMCCNAEQEQLFNRIIDMKNRVQNLAGYMQNPFFDMLNDGYISKDEINNQMGQMEVDIFKFIDELTEIKIRCNRIFRHYGT